MHFTVAGGIAEVVPDKVTVLADAAENVEEIDIERALKARERAEERLKLTLATDADRYMRITSALKRSNLSLQAAQKYRKNVKTKFRIEKLHLMAVLTRELGIDLGTSNTVFAEGNQVLLQEPTVVAIL